MVKDKIIVSNESYHSDNQYEIIYSNIKYINKLFSKGITHDNISESALKSYYVQLYFTETQRGGFSLLNKIIDKNNIILYYIVDGLKSIKDKKNLNLFKQYLAIKEENKRHDYNILDKLFNYINRDKEILKRNAEWLKCNRKLLTIDKSHLNSSYINHMKNFKENQKRINVQILKKLCTIANEEYVRITSFDSNNLYNNACHLKTLNSYFYMIKEENRYVMYDSFTKGEVSSIMIKKREKNRFFSLFRNKKNQEH